MGTPHPDGVGQSQLVGLRLGQLRDDVEHPGGIHPTLIGATANRRHGDRRFDPGLSGGSADVAPPLYRLGYRGSLVGLGERLGGHHHTANLVHAGVDGPLDPPLVEGQGAVAHPAGPGYAAHYLVTVGHLGYGFGADEAGGLDAGVAGGNQPLDEFDLLRGAEVGGIGLQPVARGHFHDLNIFGHDSANTTGKGKERT